MLAQTLLAAVAIIAMLVLRVTTDRLHARATGRRTGDCLGCAGCTRQLCHDHDHDHDQGHDDATR